MWEFVGRRSLQNYSFLLQVPYSISLVGKGGGGRGCERLFSYLLFLAGGFYCALICVVGEACVYRARESRGQTTLIKLKGSSGWSRGQSVTSSSGNKPHLQMTFVPISCGKKRRSGPIVQDFVTSLIQLRCGTVLVRGVDVTSFCGGDASVVFCFSNANGST